MDDPFHRDDLLEDPTEAEVREMEAATLAGLEAVDGPGWRLARVGGGQRGLPGHDADFVVTHDTDPDRCVRAWDDSVVHTRAWLLRSRQWADA